MSALTASRLTSDVTQRSIRRLRIILTCLEHHCRLIRQTVHDTQNLLSSMLRLQMIGPKDRGCRFPSEAVLAAELPLNSQTLAFCDFEQFFQHFFLGSPPRCCRFCSHCRCPISRHSTLSPSPGRAPPPRRPGVKVFELSALEH